MSASAAIVDPLLQRAFGLRARPSDSQRTARVRFGSSRLRAQVSRRGSAISRRTVCIMRAAGCGKSPPASFSHRSGPQRTPLGEHAVLAAWGGRVRNGRLRPLTRCGLAGQPF